MISEMKWHHHLPDIVCNQIFSYKKRVPSCEHFPYGCCFLAVGVGRHLQWVGGDVLVKNFHCAKALD